MFENDDNSDFAFGNISFVWWKFEEAVGVSYESNQMDFIDEEIALPMRCFRPRTFSYLRFHLLLIMASDKWDHVTKCIKFKYILNINKRYVPKEWLPLAYSV